jgi:hypothetical protein
MSRIHRRVAVGVVLGLGAIASAFEVEAHTTYDDPSVYGHAKAVIGRDDEGHWIGWAEWLDDEWVCRGWNQVGGPSGLSEDITLNMMYGHDLVETIWVANTSFCGFPLQPPNYNGYSIAMLGSLGNDVLFSHTVAGVWWMSGGSEGHDHLISYFSETAMQGGPDDDIVRNHAASGPGLFIHGEWGNDCVYVNSGQSPEDMFCGEGPYADNDLWSGPGTKPADCENVTYNCCGYC